jgi:uncharacterized protein YggE
MMRVTSAAVVFTAAMSGVLGGQAGPIPNPQAPEVTASGRGEVKVAPTTSSVLVSVITRAPTAAQAAADNATRLESTLKALRAAGLAQSDLTTLGYSVGQNYESSRDNPRMAAGFVARNTIRAEVRRLDDVGKVIDAALAGGATEIAGVQYSSASAQQARRSALAAAVAEARADAEAIARAAGGSLGRLIALNSSGGPREVGGMAFDTEIMLRGANSIMPRDLTIFAQVTGRWEFLPAR